MTTAVNRYQGRFRGFGAKCPRCGQPISHGLPGNPHTRKTFPCEATDTRALPYARDCPRDARRRADRAARYIASRAVMEA
jgi:hypothetical protein